MSKNKDMIKEDLEYLEKLVKESGVSIEEYQYGIITGIQEKKYMNLVNTVSRNKGLVERYIQDGRDVNIQYCNGQTLLMLACRQKDASIVELLLKNEAEINVAVKTGETALYVACYNGYKDIVKLLLNNGAEVNVAVKTGETALYTACSKGHKDIVELLLNKGAEVNAATKQGIMVLHEACSKGHKDIVELLLNNEAEINAAICGGITVLHVACNEGDKDIVELLLNNEAEINAATETGETALNIACRGGHKDIVELLLNNKAEIEATTNNGITALNTACDKGHKDIVKLLLEKEAKINYSDISAARRNGYTDIVKMLYDVDNKRKIHKLMDMYKKGDKKGAEKLLKEVKEISDEELTHMVDIYEDIKPLVKKVGYSRMGNILNKIENKNNLDKVVKEIYTKVKPSEVGGIGQELLKEKIDKDIQDICKKGNNSNRLKNLLSIADITEDFLVNIIDISKDNILEVILNNINIAMVNNIFERISENKYDVIVDKLYKRKNILNETEGLLREMIEDRIKDELIRAHQEGKEVYKQQLMNTGIDESVLDGIDRIEEKAVHSRVEVNIEKKIENKITLIDAILAGDEKNINLLKHNEDEVKKVDESGKSVLMYAVERGNNKLVEELIKDNKVDINRKDKYGKNVLMYAIEKDCVNMAKILAEKTDVYDRDNNNKSVLMYALQKGERMSCIIDLLIGDADYKDKDKKGVSILMYACQGGYMPAVEKLVGMVPEDGCNSILDYNIKGTTALRVSGENSNEEVAKYLLKNGAVDYGKLSGDKLNKLMIWWGEIYQDKGRTKTVVDKVSIRENKTRKKNIEKTK